MLWGVWGDACSRLLGLRQPRAWARTSNVAAPGAEVRHEVLGHALRLLPGLQRRMAAAAAVNAARRGGQLSSLRTWAAQAGRPVHHATQLLLPHLLLRCQLVLVHVACRVLRGSGAGGGVGRRTALWAQALAPWRMRPPLQPPGHCSNPRSTQACPPRGGAGWCACLRWCWHCQGAGAGWWSWSAVQCAALCRRGRGGGGAPRAMWTWGHRQLHQCFAKLGSPATSDGSDANATPVRASARAMGLLCARPQKKNHNPHHHRPHTTQHQCWPPGTPPSCPAAGGKGPHQPHHASRATPRHCQPCSHCQLHWPAAAPPLGHQAGGWLQPLARGPSRPRVWPPSKATGLRRALSCRTPSTAGSGGDM